MRRALAYLALMALLGAAGWFLLPMKIVVPASDALASGQQLMTKENVVVFAAHPDDAEWWVSGTAALLARNGARLRLVVASDGERGRNRNGGGDLRSMRRQEQRDAASILGYTEVSFLGLPDREVALQESLEVSIRKVFEQEQADAIITFDGARPALPYLHPDHEPLGRLVERVWRDADSKATIYRFHTRAANTAVDTSAAIDQKVKAMLAHRSQIGTGRAEGIRRSGANAGERVGVAYAELFRATEPARK